MIWLRLLLACVHLQSSQGQTSIGGKVSGSFSLFLEFDDEETNSETSSTTLIALATRVATSIDKIYEQVIKSEFVKDKLLPKVVQLKAQITAGNFTSSFKSIWVEFKSFIKEYVRNMVEATKARGDAFAKKLDEKMWLAVDDVSKVFADFQDNDWKDFYNVMLDYLEGQDSISNVDKEEKKIFELHGKIKAEVVVSGSGTNRRLSMKEGAARRLMVSMTPTDQETAIDISMKAQASAQLEVKTLDNPKTSDMRKAKLACLEGNGKEMKSKHSVVAKSCYEIVKGQLPEVWKADASTAITDPVASCQGQPRQRRAILQTLEYGMKNEIYFQAKNERGKRLPGGYLDFSLNGNVTLSARSETEITKIETDLKTVIANSIDSSVNKDWVVVQLTEVCKPPPRQAKPERNGDGRRRSPKRGDGRRRRRSKTKKNRKDTDDGRRRYRNDNCQCQCACCEARRRIPSRRLLWDDEANMSSVGRRFRGTSCEEPCRDSNDDDMVRSEEALPREDSKTVQDTPVEVLGETPRMLSDRDSDDGNAQKKKRSEGWQGLCKKQGGGKGSTAVKVYFDVIVPPIEDDQHMRISAKVKMDASFKKKVSVNAQGNAEVSFQASVGADMDLEAGYKDKSRPTRGRLTEDFKMVFQQTVDCHKEVREKIFKNAKAFKDMSLENYNTYKINLQKAIERVQTSKNDVGGRIKLGVQGEVSLKIVKEKVEKGEKLEPLHARTMARVSAMASVDIDFQRKVEENDEAKEFEMLSRAVQKAEFNEFSAGFRAKFQSALDMTWTAKSPTEKAECDTIMAKMVKGESLTTDERVKVDLNMKLGAEVTVVKEEKLRMDFAAEASNRLSLKMLSAQEKQEVIDSFNAAAKIKIHMCADAKVLTHQCSAGKNDCWSITTPWRTHSDAMNNWCQSSCRDGAGQLSPACQPNTDLAHKVCSCCGDVQVVALKLEDECEEFNDVWRLVNVGDFEQFQERQEMMVKQIIRDGKAWANKKYMSFSNAAAKNLVYAEEYILNLVNWKDLEAEVKATINLSLEWVKVNKGRLHQYFEETELNNIDNVKDNVNCLCKEEMSQPEMRTIRLSLDLKAKADISAAQDGDVTHTKIQTGLKIKLKSDSADVVKTKEFKAAVRATVGVMIGGNCQNCEVGEPVGSRRLLLGCESGRCLQEATFTVPVTNTVDALDVAGDKDENMNQDLESASTEDVCKILKAQAVGALKATDVLDCLEVVEPENEKCSSGDDCIPKKPELLAGNPDSSLAGLSDGTRVDMFITAATLATTLASW